MKKRNHLISRNCSDLRRIFASKIPLRPKEQEQETMQRTNRSYLFIILILIIAASFFFWNRFTDERRQIDSHTREITPRGSLADFEKTTISIYQGGCYENVF